MSKRGVWGTSHFKNKALGRLSLGSLATGLFALILLLGIGLVWGGQLFSPGPLNAQGEGETLGGVTSHAETSGRCSACHVALWSNETMSDRCVLCHIDVANQLRDPTSLHGVVMRSGEIQSCVHCHPEHRGNDAQLTTLDPATFPHEATGFSLQSHQQMADGTPFACADCHGEDLTHFDPARCAVCHQEMSTDCTPGADCLTCHDGQGERSAD